MNFGNQIAIPTDPTLYGNGILWTGIPSPAWSVWDPRTRMIGIKMGWFRARPGRVTLTAKPLDGRPARFTGQVGTPAEYGPTGFAASGLAFGRSGCWKVHASLAAACSRSCSTSVPGTPPGQAPISSRYKRRAARVRQTSRLLHCTAVSVAEVDEYLQRVDEPKRSTLEALRRTILEVVPEAEQGISYRVPAFRVGGKVVAGFAAFKDHLSYLPFSGSVLGQLTDELQGYAMTKSSLHFPVDRPLAKALVEKLLAARFDEIA